MNDNPILSEVRRIKEKLASDFNYDIHAMFEDMRQREWQFGNRLVYPPTTNCHHELTPTAKGQDSVLGSAGELMVV